MTKIAAIADLHGNLPPIPECDILLIAGDICPNSHSLLQVRWLNVAFRDWLDQVPAKHVVAVAGNHDLVFERCSHLVPVGMRWHYLQHGGVELEGLKIFGMPWISPIWGAFQRDEAGLEKKYSQIPGDVDVVVSHGPPHGIGDVAPRRITAENEGEWPAGEHCGSPALRNRLLEIKPKLVVFGHIHEGHGVYCVEDITFANVSLMNHMFVPTHYPFVIDI